MSFTEKLRGVGHLSYIDRLKTLKAERLDFEE